MPRAHFSVCLRLPPIRHAADVIYATAIYDAVYAAIDDVFTRYAMIAPRLPFCRHDVMMLIFSLAAAARYAADFSPLLLLMAYAMLPPCLC